MTTVADLVAWMERFAPRRLAESWDNVGLLLGDPIAPVERVMTCLTVTATTADEAIRRGAGAIVTHHPILFKATRTLRADQPDTGFVWRLARAGVAVLSPHTSFDNTEGGINDGLARRFGLVDIGPLRVQAAEDWYKLVVFVPEGEANAITTAAFAAGAGRLGAYAECSFTAVGTGTFRGSSAANPTIGVAGGPRESVREARVEFLCAAADRARVVAAVRAAHSYEEPAIDLSRLEPTWPSSTGSGRIGRLATPERLGQFARRVATILRAPATRFVGDPDRLIKRVALCCGAGDEFLGDAITRGADVYVTGEARYHRAVEAESRGIGLIVAGHHATERPGVEDLAGRIAAEWPAMAVWASESEMDPLQPVVTLDQAESRDDAQAKDDRLARADRP